MPRKNKDVLKMKEITLARALQVAMSDDEILLKENAILELSEQITLLQYELSRKQEELDAKITLRDQKLGRAYDMTNDNKQLISANLTSEEYEKCLTVKELYYDGLSGYIRHLIDNDLHKNWKSYEKLAKLKNIK